MARKSLIIVGGGMVGAACALRLQAAGAAVTLIDPGPAERASSFGNAGHIAVEQVEPLSSWSTVLGAPGQLFWVGGPLDFRLSDIPAWLPWTARFLASCRASQFRRGSEALGRLMFPAVEAWRGLLELAGASDLMVEDGHTILWFEKRSARRGQGRWARAETGPARVQALPDQDLEAYRTVLSRRPPVAGMRVHGTARLVSPQGVRDALLAAFLARGGQRLTASVRRVSTTGEVELVDGSRRTADQILVAAGARSGLLMAESNLPVPLIAERGYSIQFAAPEWPAALPTTVVEDQAIVLAPQAEGLRATSYVEFARPDSPPDPRKWDRLIGRVRALGFKVPDDCQRWMGCRPTLPDYVPAIGALPGHRLLYAFGHQHLGVTLAAVTAEKIERLADGAEVEPCFDLRRFRS